MTAKLHYRSFSQGQADLLLGKGAIKVPSVEVVTIEVTVMLARGRPPVPARLIIELPGGE